MRIAILHYTQPPVIGGVERVISDQARALRHLGHEVDIFTASSWRERMAQRAGSSQTPSFREGGSEEGAGGFDAVIVHNIFTMPFDLDWARELRELAAKDGRTRWINWVHDVAAANPYYTHLPWQDAPFAILKEAPAGCLHVAVSETRRQDYARVSHLDAAAIQVIPNGIDIAAVLGLTERVAALRLWQHELMLFHPARLIRRKNIQLGIRVCAELRARNCAAVYVVTGAPDPHQEDGLRYHEELKVLASAAGVADHVLFLGEEGVLSDADILGLYAMADALFFPSDGEGFGLPLLEAVAHRLPVFCSDLAVHREVIGAQEGFFRLDAPPAGIAAQILEWSQTSPDLRRRREIWRRYDMVKICQERLEPLLRIA